LGALVSVAALVVVGRRRSRREAAGLRARQCAGRSGTAWRSPAIGDACRPFRMEAALGALGSVAAPGVVGRRRSLREAAGSRTRAPTTGVARFKQAFLPRAPGGHPP